MNFAPATELEGYEALLIEHLESMLRGLQRLSPEHWDWTPNQAAPTPRTVAAHAWQWLICDRQHIDEPDVSKHKNVAEPPADIDAFCDAFAEETENWRQLLRRLTPADLDSPRHQFGEQDTLMNVRHFIDHMTQNVIYKHGQFAEVFYALGYDGTVPYTAPLPNAIYEEIRLCPPHPSPINPSL